MRCTDDGVAGRIVWVNAVSVKVKWDDGEQVTWRRDAPAGRPIAILDEVDAAAAEPAEPPLAVPAPEPAGPTELPATTPEPLIATEPPATEVETPPSIPEQAAEAEGSGAGSVPPAPEPTETAPPAPGSESASVPAPAQPKRERKKAPAAPGEKKLSAPDAAARVLAEAGQALTCKELIAAMALQGLWTSPGGRTPDATLYAALLRKIAVKGEQARFAKAAPGRFTLRGAV